MSRAVKSTDLLDLAFVSDPQLSPTGERAAVVVSRAVMPEEWLKEGSGKANGKPQPPHYRSRIKLFATPGAAATEPLELTRGEYRDTAPRFSPSGTELAFLRVSEEGGKPQLYVIPLAGGEARRLTNEKAGVREFAWHPDGERLAYLSLGEYVDRVKERGEALRITRARWRQEGVGLRPGAKPALYLVNAKSGESRKLVELREKATAPAFSPCGERLFLTSESPEDPASEPRGDLLMVKLESGEVTPLLTRLLGLAESVPSPSGRLVAYSASKDQNDFVSGPGLYVMELSDDGSPAGEPRLISGELDVKHSAGGDSRYGAYPGVPAWVGEDALLAISNVEGRARLMRFALDGSMGAAQPAGERVVTDFCAAQDGGMVVFLAESPTEPGELFAVTGGVENRLSAENDAWRAALLLHPISGPFKAGEGGANYWVMEPVLPREDRAAVVQVHGGPHTNYGYGFYFEFQLLAANGFAVIFGNPRGSSSYGYTFATAMLGAYGSVDADDIMAFTEEGLRRLSREGAPVHLTGGSYGGFMTNWLVGRTDRFRSAVTQRSISNWTSMYGTSDIGPWFTERQLNGVPWGDAEALWRQSPIRLAENVRTPLLIIHSEEDYRCPIEQAEQFYAVLKRLGNAPTEFLRVPGEGHELSRSGRPDRRLARLDAILDWFARH